MNTKSVSKCSLCSRTRDYLAGLYSVDAATAYTRDGRIGFEVQDSYVFHLSTVPRPSYLNRLYGSTKSTSWKGEAMARLLFSLMLALAVTAAPSVAIAKGNMPEPQRYYDFWPGDWYEVKNGLRDEQPTFVVRRGVHPLAFMEDWRLVVDGKEDRSFGLRVWNPQESRWSFVWTNSSGVYQVWDSLQIGEDWYIQRAFDQSGNHWLSRQAWIPHGRDRLVRVLERSNDNGQTWFVRSKKTFVRGVARQPT